MKSRFQNKVAGSELTLPVCGGMAVILWWLPGWNFSVRNVLGLLLCLLTTYIVMETNARQLIIRIRTRIMSSVWLVLSTSLAFMHPLGEPLIAASLLCLAYPLLFHCYQHYNPQVYVFHAFLMLGIGSFFAPVMLLMAIPFFVYLAIFLRSLTWKAFWAGILGIIVPYWCYVMWYIIMKDIENIPQHLPFTIYHLEAVANYSSQSSGAGGSFSSTKSTLFTFHFSLSFAVLSLLCIVSIIHYLRTNYDDKIRVRMILYIYVIQTLMLMTYLVLQPAQYETTMALLVASACPLIAHYIALSKGILNTIFFILSLLLVAAMATLNLWMTSFSFS